MESQSSDDLNFKIGYAFFEVENYEQAAKYLLKTDQSSTIGMNAAYYLGIIKEKEQAPQSAKEYYQIAINSESFGKEALKRSIGLMFQKADYQSIVNTMEENEITWEDASVSKIVGQSYFELKKYRLAAFNLKEYLRLSRKRNDYLTEYKLGICASRLKDPEASLQHYKIAALSDDTLGAYASYQMGQLYLSDSNYVFAVAAFNKAKILKTEMQEEAVYLEAKSEFDQGNFSAAISGFKDYTSKYPQGQYMIKVSEMLSEALISSDDYTQAIEYIESLDRLTPGIKRSYQQVTYLKGVERFNKRRFFESIGYFEKSLLYDEDLSLIANTNYWIGESYTIGKKYSQAIPYYQRTIAISRGENLMKAKYGLAYALYNLKRYRDSKGYFKEIAELSTENLDKKYIVDALVRLGDVHFVTKEYDQAIRIYARAITQGTRSVPYAQFQIGLAYRYLGNSEAAINAFQNILDQHRDSDRADDAQFQISQVYYENGQFNDALPVYETFLKSFPDSKYIPYALLNSAVTYNNLQQYKGAVKNYITILEKYARHTVAKSALLGLQDLSGRGKFNDFDTYLEMFKKANPDNTALENIEFETAKTQFYNQEYDLAINSFQRFMIQYPGSQLNTEAIYFIGDSWYRKNEGDSALVYFRKIESEHEFSRYLRVQYRIALLEQEKGNPAISNVHFHLLKSSANNAKEIANANRGLMKNYFATARYDSAIWYSNQLLEGTRISADVESEAILTIGKSEFYRKNYNNALDAFITLLNGGRDEYGAEAKYFTALIFYQQKDYNHSLQHLFELSRDYSNYHNWVGKAFLLMADNYVATEEIFQANATLKSLIENAPLENIREEASKKLAQIENLQTSEQLDSLKVENKK